MPTWWAAVRLPFHHLPLLLLTNLESALQGKGYPANDKGDSPERSDNAQFLDLCQDQSLTERQSEYLGYQLIVVQTELTYSDPENSRVPERSQRSDG